MPSLWLLPRSPRHVSELTKLSSRSCILRGQVSRRSAPLHVGATHPRRADTAHRATQKFGSDKRSRTRSSRPLSVHEWLVIAINTFLLSHFFTRFVGTINFTTGESMLPTIVSGDEVIVSKRHRRGSGVEVGDIVSFQSPVITRHRVIKRIIGMPGDFVLRDSPPGAASIVTGAKGEVVDVVEDSSSRDHWMVQVPKGHCWVVGDNAPFSRDSRHFGPVPLALIRGKVIAKYERFWLPSTWTWFLISKNSWPGVEKNLARSIEDSGDVRFGPSIRREYAKPAKET